MSRHVLLLASCLTLAASFDGFGQDLAPSAKEIEYFEKHVRPLLSQHCYECHGAKEQEGELRLDTYAGIMQGGQSGTLLTIGQPDRSLLIAALLGKNEDLAMPPDDKLPDNAIAHIAHWIKVGAPHPDANGLSRPPRPRVDWATAKSHWSFQPPQRHPLPTVKKSDWPNNPIDFFVLFRLEELGLSPAASADRRTLIRRATFDLTGLPPTPEEVQEFLDDPSDGAFAVVVDRLLESPHYGERWGRYWLDVARYADSNGLDENIAHGNAWRYRDYVVEAFNTDKPYDQFLREQIAGDLMSTDDAELRRERLIATGFLSLGPKVLAEVDQTKMEMDIIDEQIDTLGRAVLGLTMGCARCHDHKFDPLSMRDYYAMAGIFKSTRVMEHYKKIARWWENPVATKVDQKRKQEHGQVVSEFQAEIDAFIESANAKVSEALAEAVAKPKDAKQFEQLYSDDVKQRLKELREKLAELQQQAPELPTAMGASERDVVNVAVHLRGSHLSLGETIPRRFPLALAGMNQAPLPEDRSGRMELAEWLTQKANPLTSRVIVNRIWRWHFGRGIVPSVDNFGKLGDLPTHPKLLDWLATQFVEYGWSIKELHRQIMLSSTYQMSCAANEQASKIDPDNLLYWRSDIRRLEAEAVRDAMLSVSGLLDRSMRGSLLHVKNREFFFNHTSQDTTNYDSRRRSLYLPIVRNHLYDVFQLFDYADASVTNGNRASTTVAPQALFMMNSRISWKAAESLADQALAKREFSDADRVQWLYANSFAREATAQESARSLEFLTRAEAVSVADKELSSRRKQAWTSLAHVILSANEFIYVR